MGFGCASKWTGVYAGAGLGIIFFGIMLKRYFEYRQAWNDPKGKSGNIENSQIVMNFKRNILLTIGFCVIAFVIIPGTIFTLSYIPFNNGTDMGLIQRMIKNQMDMWNYHSQLNDTHPFSSHWYEWIIMKRPIWYYNTTISGTVQGNISAFGNPLVWWAGIPAFFYLLYRIVKRVDTKALFLVVAYLAQLLPWVPVTRCTFIYHYFPSVPFVTLMFGYSMYCLYEFAGNRNDQKTKRTKAQNIVLIALCIYVVAAIALFAWFYPVLSGYPMETSYGEGLRWFKSWVLYSGS
jgi:dolichyl-phosphate-mannose--protein O-mannosyl transferase